ncbi:MAG: POTRA domain-containing protein [Gilvibacter sp.]
MNLEIELDDAKKNSLIDSILPNKKFANLTTLNREIDSVELRLNYRGYLANRFYEPIKLNDSTYTLKIELAKQYKTVKVVFDPAQLDGKILRDLSDQITADSFTVPFSQIESVLNTISERIARDGFPFASVQLTRFDIDRPSLVYAKLKVEYGKARTISGVEVKGYDKFPKSFVKYYAGIKKGQAFDQKQISKKFDNLSSLGFANSIKAPEVLFRKDSTQVYLYLEKKSNNTFDGILGFANSEEDSKIIFNGYLDLVLSNNLNFGETLAINYKSDGNEQQNFKVRTNLPYLFGSPLGVDLELYLFKRDSSFVSVEQKASAFYQLSPKFQLHGGYLYKESNNLQDEALTNTAIEDLTSNFFLAGISYTDPQGTPLYPFKSKAQLFSRFGNRKANLESQQTYLGLTGFHIFNLNTRNSIYLRTQVETLISDNYVTNELLRFGGINSIRGFEENSIDAQLLAVVSTEYRYLLNNALYAHSIIDAGYFENELTNTKEELVSFGFGLGFLSKAGVFKLNIANGKTQSLPFKFSNTKIHLSLTSKF